jgi:AraC family transcriptional regulator of adaptative response/methylated-DNA-[protein]-cysteine methyltransferase
MNDNGLWQAVASRDAAADGCFVYAVSSTGVYCRPSCASRRPRRDRVEFFPSPAMAAASGYRACKRCKPDGPAGAPPAVARVQRVCEAVARRPDARWTSAALARVGRTSIAQLQRGFRATLGLSPRDYAAACRRRKFLAALRNGQGVTSAIYDAGYSSPSRVYHGIRLPGMTPATYGRGGDGARIDWLTVASPLGRILVAATPRGLCFVEVGRTTAQLREALAREFPRAHIAPRPSARLRPYADMAKSVATVDRPSTTLPVDIRGTAFQWRVWRALTRIPPGETRSYAALAESVGQPAAVRAVAGACARNPLALVVPCHRVIRADGGSGGYRWGAEIKETLIKRERGEPQPL